MIIINLFTGRPYFIQGYHTPIRRKGDAILQSQCLFVKIKKYVTDVYVPPTIVEGHYVFWSVCPSVCPVSG